MVQMTKSFSEWCFKFYPEKYSLLMFGHLEELTDEMWQEYIEWVQRGESDGSD